LHYLAPSARRYTATGPARKPELALHTNPHPGRCGTNRNQERGLPARTEHENEGESALTPQDTLEKGLAELLKTPDAELLELVKSKSALFFERLVLQVGRK
jgi:restriction endonuclease Mrr